MLGMFWNERKCKDMSRFFFVRVSANTIHIISWNIEISTSFFPLQPDIFLLQNHPLHAFHVSKTWYVL